MGTDRRELTFDRDLEMSTYRERLFSPALSSGIMQTSFVWEVAGEDRRVDPDLVCIGNPHLLLPLLMVPT